MVYFEEKELRRVVLQIIENQGFSVNSEITLSKGSDKGDGYLGEIVRVLVKDGANNLNLIAKIAMNDEKIRATFPYSEAFKNEIHLYEKIFPALVKLQIEANFPSLFNPVPRFYSASTSLNHEYLILEDLKSSRFEMLDLKELLDHEHTKAIFETYGKLHGTFFALKILKNEQFFELVSEVQDVMKIMFVKNNIGEEYPKVWKYIQKVMKDKGVENERIINYAENSLTIMQNFCNIGKEKFHCFLHGDCWSNNLMFRHKNFNDHKEVDEMKLLDWQACKVGPPVYDLSYTFYSGAPKEILANLEKYLKIYHESLSKILLQFHLDVNTVYPFEEMKRQWKKYYHYGAILSGPIWKFRSFGENQGVDPLNYKSDDGSTYMNAISSADCDTDYLYANIKNLLHHLDEIDDRKILN
ncbi:hypothetical protein WA026_017829 [Henosepilachna vigintioctopunctata]|uniref:CHK kinase-like domain-containing protein n=1 Tax=Henosepilachna vigintioctopunctata TaxID=420089 RepID=A0AAW1TXE9_9CUCU